MTTEEPRSARSEEDAASSGGGAVHIGSMSGGAIATGRHGRAVSHLYGTPPSGTDEATLALLEAVGTLREHLRLLAPDADTAVADGELAEVQAGITADGRAEPGLLERVRIRLESTGSAVATLASAAGVVEAIAGILG
jgi:hypothetical protein